MFWRISATFLLMLTIVGFAYIYITAYSAEMYFQEANQRLSATIAEHIVHDIPPFANGTLNKQVLDDLFHHVMVINPSLEVYLLDSTGRILSYFAPNKKIQLQHIDLAPIHRFIGTDGQQFIMGDDPRHPGEYKAFSAAAVTEGTATIGYVYVILASEEYASTAHLLLGSYILRVGVRATVITLLAALAIGLFFIWVLTKNLNVVISTVRRFSDGDRKARIALHSRGELTQLAETFNEMADTIAHNIDYIEAMEKHRSELIANVSHDLRTPLSIIHGYIETMLMKHDTMVPADRNRYMQTVLHSTERLKKLVEELFEFSKLEAMQVKPIMEPFVLTELLHDMSHKYQLLAQEKGILIKIVTSNDVPLVYADVALIERVLQNLIDNAIKFTPEHGVVTIQLHPTDTAIEVRVADTGSGIPDSELPYIFDRYHKAGRFSNSGNREGTGLGLAIVKKILELHNSDIHVQTALHRGTTFVFHLPRYHTER